MKNLLKKGLRGVFNGSEKIFERGEWVNFYGSKNSDTKTYDFKNLFEKRLWGFFNGSKIFFERGEGVNFNVHRCFKVG